MNWFIIATAILVVAGIFSLIKSLTNNGKKETENQATATPQLEQRIKSKASYGKMWNWIIPIGIISALVLGFWLAPKYFKGAFPNLRRSSGRRNLTSMAVSRKKEPVAT